MHDEAIRRAVARHLGSVRVMAEAGKGPQRNSPQHPKQCNGHMTEWRRGTVETQRYNLQPMQSRHRKHAAGGKHTEDSNG